MSRGERTSGRLSSLYKAAVNIQVKKKMMKKLQVYRDLQKHLDAQPVGFPAVRSGADIRLLMRHFTEEEAGIAVEMSYRYETAGTIHQRLEKKGLTLEQLKTTLEAMSSKMSIMQRETGGVLYYCLIPLVIGMYEGMVFDMDSGYVKAYDEYAHSMQHGLSFISTELMQMRTIPVEKSIETRNHVMQYDNIVSLIESAEGPVIIIECTCRKRKRISGEPCSRTSREETCMVFGDIARLMKKYGRGREIGKAEALEISRQSQKEGLVLQTYNMQRPDVICACCSCCCEILGIHRTLVNPVNFWSSNFHAAVNSEKCTGCGLCVKWCQVDAVRIDKKKKKASIMKNRCIGCGNCITKCRTGALLLERNRETGMPPADFVDLQEIIMRNKPVWRLGRIISRILGLR